MNLTDEELMQLEQLTYLNDDVYRHAGIDPALADSYNNAETVEDFLYYFDDAAIKKLEDMGDMEVLNDKGEGTHVSGAEWASMIKSVQNNDRLKNLEVSHITSVDTADGGYNLDAMTFSEAGNSEDAIVCFRGTLNGEEWRDNGEYLAAAATDCNQQALMYINGLPYSNITVVGHSKGANKAAYVYFESDKVSYCVAMDMPGFPPEFYLQNAQIIETKKDGIKCYALESDYVNILVLPIPGVEPIYCQGNGVANFAENHCPNSFFFYDESGQPVVVVGEPSESMKILHDFTAFAALEMPYEDRIKVGNYLGNILSLVLGGEDFEPEELIEAVFSDPDALTTFAAYFKKYCELYDVDVIDAIKIGLDIKFNNDEAEETLALLKAAGVGGAGLGVAMAMPEIAIIALILLVGGSAITYKKYKEIIDLLIEKLSETSIVSDTNAKVAALADLKKRESLDYEGYGGKKYNYTKEAFSTIKSNITTFNNLEYELPSNTWNDYSEAEWYSDISAEEIKIALKGFIDKVPVLNDNCKTEFENAFNKEWAVDNSYQSKLSSHALFVTSAYNVIRGLKDRLESNIHIEY